MTAADLESRLDWLELLMARCRDPKDLPALGDTYGKILDRLVRLDLEGKTDEADATGDRSRN